MVPAVADSRVAEPSAGHFWALKGPSSTVSGQKEREIADLSPRLPLQSRFCSIFGSFSTCRGSETPKSRENGADQAAGGAARASSSPRVAAESSAVQQVHGPACSEGQP